MHRLNSYLHAHHAFSLLGINIRVDIGLEALTKDSDNTDEDGAEQINLKKGLGPNYERLEFLGDCFLKMASSPWIRRSVRLIFL
jgi:endoribonuclease Dicer